MRFGTIRHSLSKDPAPKRVYLKDQPKGTTIHHSVRVYSSGDRVEQGVLSADLDDHTTYNQVYRFGCALFIDGVCKNQGYLDQVLVAAIEKELKAKPVTYDSVTVPYR